MWQLATKNIWVTQGNVSSWIYLTGESGAIIYRDKIDTLTGVCHPGIILGNDRWGTTWVIHNHYKNGYAMIETMQQFSMGEVCRYDNKPVFYNVTDIIERAIEHYHEKQPYHWLINNCQHFVNNVTQDLHYSETVDRLSDRAMVAGGITAFIGMLTNNKSTVNTGLAIVGIGTLGKGISRY